MVEATQAYGETETDGPEEDYWIICLHEVAGCPAILRLISGVPDVLAATSCDERVDIHWHYEAEADGLPIDAESARMDFFEDVLAEAVEEGMGACLAMVTTAKGTKEWTVYAEYGEDVAAFVTQVARGNDLPLEVRCEKDPDWSAYHRLLAKAQDQDSQ